MVVTLVPQVAYAASTADSTPSLSAYASKAQMTDSTFAPRRDGNAVNTGKLVLTITVDESTNDKPIDIEVPFDWI